jgi:hypothetical protein
VNWFIAVFVENAGCKHFRTALPEPSVNVIVFRLENSDNWCRNICRKIFCQKKITAPA